MSFREKFLGTKVPCEIIDTPAGKVEVRAPMAGRVEAFRKTLGDSNGNMPMTPSVLMGLCCFEPETGVACFGPADVGELDKLPVSAFGPLMEAVVRVGESLKLDPTTPATELGST